MRCEQLTRTKYAPVMGTTIRRRNEDLIAINSSAVSYLKFVFDSLFGVDGGFLPFRSVSNAWRAIPSPRVKHARSGSNGFRQTEQRSTKNPLAAGLLGFASMGPCPHGGDGGGVRPDWAEVAWVGQEL